MARVTKCHSCVFDFICFITEQHVYKDNWTPIFQEELNCDMELSNYHSKYAIKIIKEIKTVGHIQQLFTKAYSLILLSGGAIKVHVTGKLENQIGNGLEVLCILTIKGYLHYKMITPQNVLSEAQVKNFFIS